MPHMTTTTNAERVSPADLAGAEPEFTLGDRLAKALDFAGISVGTMAEMLDVSRATMSRWLHDKGPIKRVYLQVWSDLTGVSTHWLETGEYAMRDLNPQPADMEHVLVGGPVLRLIHDRRDPRPPRVNRRLTTERRAS